MARGGKVTGLDEVMENLTKETKRIVGATESGVTKAALLLRKESMKKTPVKFGNLRASHAVVSSALSDPPGGGGGPFKGDDAATMAAQHVKEKKLVALKARAKKALGPVAAVVVTAIYAWLA
jgi:hypothetical protein